MIEKFRNDTMLMNEVIEKLYQRCGEAELKEICALLDKIYLADGAVDPNFRHEYSSISGKMEELRGKFGTEENPFDLQNISINIRLLYEYAEENEKPYLKNLFKLRDHIFLEIGRIAYSDKIYESITEAKSELKQSIETAISDVQQIDGKIEMSKELLSELGKKYDEFSEKIDDQQARIASTNDVLDKTNKTLEKSKKKIKSYQQESIAILGIFAAIVLAVAGGLGFSSSVLESINKGTIYRICFVVLLLGLVLVNVLYALFYYIDRLVNDTEERRIKPLLISNLILVLLLAFLFALWQYGYVERVGERHKELYQEAAVGSVSDNR